MNPILLYLAWRATRRASVRTPSRLAGAARVTAYVALLAVGLGAVSVRKARADVGSAALDLGRELGGTTHGLEGGYTAILNGQRFRLGESHTASPVGAVLDAAEAGCRAQPGALAGLFEAMPEKGTLAGGKPYKLEGSFTHGIVRNGTEKDGVVVCFVGDPSARRPATEALAAFAASQDLGDLGELRYTYAKREGDETKVTVASTESHFRLRALSTGGEELGRDGAVPRLPGAKRILSAEIEGTPQLTNVLVSEKSEREVVAYYDQTLEKAGFLRVTPPSAEHTLRLYHRDAFDVIVAARADDGRTVVAVTEQRFGSKSAKSALEVSP